MAIQPSDVSLEGRVAVVTGGGAGIGRGIAAGLAAFGASVAIWERDPDSSAAAAEEIGGLSVPTDVRDSEQVDAALAQTVDALGTVSILVNNAGGVFVSSFLEISDNGMDALYRANLRHVLVCSQRVARGMVAAGIGGSITSVTSIEGVRAAPGYAAYAAAKAGVINFTKTAALELAPHGIRVNALAPDITLTEGIAALAPPDAQAHFGDTVPMGRAGHVDEMAGAAVFLASDLASYITGQTIHVDGGTHAASGWYHHPETGEYLFGTPGVTSTSVDAILVATRRVIAERGPEKFTMSAIAAAAGVSRPTLYRWFPTKDALLEALTAYEGQQFDTRLREVIAAQRSAGARLDAALRFLVTYLDGLMGPDPIGADPAFAIQSLAGSLVPFTRTLVRLLGDGMQAVPAVRRGQLTPEQAAELFMRIAYSHYLVPHPDPEVLLATMRSLAGLSHRSITTAAS